MLNRIELVIKNNELKKENLAVCKVNQELDKQLQRNKFCRQEAINFLNNNVRELLNLQDINSLGISEGDKNKHRNIIINKLVENCLDKINELSSTVESFR